MSTSENFYARMRIVCLNIPTERVATYGQIALLCGKPNNSRQVGYGLKMNLAGTGIPAHRVVNSKGELSGAEYFLFSGLQKNLLQGEGISAEWNGKRWQVDLRKYGWKYTLEDFEYIQSQFEKIPVNEMA